MEFSTIDFIIRFLPVFLIIYYLVPNRFRNMVLLVGSIGFYIYGEPRFILLLVCSVIVNYYSARALEGCLTTQTRRRILLVVTLTYNIGILAFFKYFQVSVPVGLSFYTFSIVSYVLDVYMGKEEAEHSILTLGTYVTMFPKLISGPIATYQNLKGELKERKITIADVEEGCMIFIIGLGYKVIIANHMGILWHDIRTIGFESISTPLAWMGAFGFCVQLFFDFQGYSLMAIGVGRALGFHLPVNFDHPYRSRSVSEFYRRWHMTLGQWFKNYVYIPLGGNRAGVKRTVVNLGLVWLLTGIWHGSTWNFPLWGIVIFICIAVEKLWLKDYLDEHPVFSHLYLLFVIPLTWVIFAIDRLPDLGTYFMRLFPIVANGVSVNSMDFVKYGRTYALFFVLAFLVSLPVMDRIYDRCKNHIVWKIFLFGIFWLSIYQIVTGENNPFLYFSF